MNTAEYPLECRWELFNCNHNLGIHYLESTDRRSIRAFSLRHHTDSALLDYQQFEAFINKYANELLTDNGSIRYHAMPTMSDGERRLREAMRGGKWNMWIDENLEQLVLSKGSRVSKQDKIDLTLMQMGADRMRANMPTVFTYKDMAALLADTTPLGWNLSEALLALDTGGNQDWYGLLKALDYDEAQHLIPERMRSSTIIMNDIR